MTQLAATGCLDEVRKALQVLHEPGEVFEIRALGSRGPTIGYYNDLEAALETVARLDVLDEVHGIYVTLNQLNPACLARSANRSMAAATASSDKDIDRRRYLLVDLDPVRPAGTSSTSDELDAAQARATLIRDSLRARGWPEPIEAVSGNGMHLLYPIDLPNDNAARNVIANVLGALELQFGDSSVAIDTTVSNAARIVRVHGTIARKGDNVDDRPHRRSAIVDVPAERNLVSRALLDELAATLPSKRMLNVQPGGPKHFDLAAFIARNDIEIIRSGVWNDANKWVIACCPFDTTHTNGCAVLLQFSSGAVAFKCHHNSCANRKWIDVRECFEPGAWSSSKDDNLDGSTRRDTQADQLVDLILNSGAKLVHDAAQIPYAVVPLSDSVQVVHPIRSQSFRTHLAHDYYTSFGKTPKAAAITDARAVLEGRAQHSGQLVDVALRVAGDDESIDVDLGDDQWRRVRVTRDGWSIVPHGDRLFRRPPGMLALRDPIPGGDLAELREFIRVDDESFVLLVAFLVNAVSPRGPYPILLLTGEHGCAKTTTARVLRRILDPNKVDVRAECQNERDLAIAANNSHILALDNLSHIPQKLSDALCRLATGGGFMTRMLYTDQDEVFFDSTRPMIITSIVDVASRPDLLDRCLTVRLRPIPEHARLTESELWNRFEVAQPRLFGALLDAASMALRNVLEVTAITKSKPRMADAYTWALAAGPAASIDAKVLAEAWRRTGDEANASTLESSLVASPLQELVRDCGGFWSGNATRLLVRLAEESDEATTRRREWPKTPRELAGEVRRISPALRAAGIEHDEYREPGTGQRQHSFTSTNLGIASQSASPSSHPSQGSVRPRQPSNDEAAQVAQSPRADGAAIHIKDAPWYVSRDDRDAHDDDFLPLLDPLDPSSSF